MTDVETRPPRCRFRLQDEGKPYPRSSCQACERTITTGLGNRCSVEKVRTDIDNAAVDQFSRAMKFKLALSRGKGRSGWDDPAQCSEAELADLFVSHLSKRNPGNFVDLANLCMMLHLRNAKPGAIASRIKEARNDQ